MVFSLGVECLVGIYSTFSCPRVLRSQESEELDVGQAQEASWVAKSSPIQLGLGISRISLLISVG